MIQKTPLNQGKGNLDGYWRQKTSTKDASGRYQFVVWEERPPTASFKKFSNGSVWI